jgi:hypothetical protein
MLTLENLIEKGYLPQEVIPPLNTESLAAALPTITANLHTFTSPRSTKCDIYSLPRLKNFRRVLGIPNPLHQVKLSKTVVDNWADISTFLAQSDISISTPLVAANSTRAVVAFRDFSDVKFERALRSTSARYLLRVDISRFYHSIYTHCIPWVLHTKAVAKANRGSSLWGNVVDTDVRNTRDGQTMGIPIGPDTSRIISEIIGVGIDLNLKQRVPNLIGVRHVDDFWLYFKSLADLEMGYSAIQYTLQEFELELNPTKAKVIELPEIFDEKWVHELQSFRFRNKTSAQRNDLISYFNLAFQNAVIFPDDYVLQYALAKASQNVVAPENWDIFEALLLRTIIVEPKVLPIVLRIFLTYQNQGYTLNLQKILETVEQLLEYHCKLSHSFEVSWGLWFCRALKLTLSSTIADLVSKVDDSVTALVALDLETSGLTITRFDKTMWQKHVNTDGLNSEYWLLAYEANIKGWLSHRTGHDYIGGNSFFNMLRANNVSFYNESKEVNLVDIFTTSVEVSLPFDLSSLIEDLDTEDLAVNPVTEGLTEDDLPF